MKLSVIGLGKLGLPMVAYFASRGCDVIGLDYNAGLVEALNRGECPISETALPKLLKAVHDKVSYTRDYDVAVMGSDISFIIVPTPSDKGGKFSNKYVLAAAREIARALKNKEGYHLVVVTSTVMPGTCEGLVKPVLEGLTGKKCGLDFGLCYNPEFIALGSVLADMAAPDAVLIGRSDAAAGGVLSVFYKAICPKGPPVCYMSLWNAEMAKLTLNVALTFKISLGNAIAEVCDAMPSGDADAVAQFIGCDSRIGPKLLKGGLGFGGPCLPRDNKAFMVMARKLGVRTPLQQSVDMFNRMHAEWVANKALGLLRRGSVAVLGLTYKPHTNIVDDSMAFDIVHRLMRAGCEVGVCDPQGRENAALKLTDTVRYCPTVEDCLKGAGLCILATPWPQFKDVKPRVLKDIMVAPVVLDCWRFWDRREFIRAGVEYHALGVNDG